MSAHLTAVVEDKLSAGAVSVCSGAVCEILDNDYQRLLTYRHLEVTLEQVRRIAHVDKILGIDQTITSGIELFEHRLEFFAGKIQSALVTCVAFCKSRLGICDERPDAKYFYLTVILICLRGITRCREQI